MNRKTFMIGFNKFFGDSNIKDGEYLIEVADNKISIQEIKRKGLKVEYFREWEDENES